MRRPTQLAPRSGYLLTHLSCAARSDPACGAVSATNPLAYAPAEADGVLYDSVCDRMERPSIYVTFNDAQAMPVFLLTLDGSEGGCGFG